MFLVHNEQTKLTASLCNALAASLVAAGVFAPVVALLYGFSRPEQSTAQTSLITLTCIGGGAFLHSLGRRMLRRLHE